MIDLQLHTTDSDGTWPWDQVLKEAHSLGLKACAITDHDTVVRLDQVRAWGEARKFLAIPGIELSTRDQGETVHLLGYFLEGPLQTLQEQLRYLGQGRAYRNKLIIKKLNFLGIGITEEEVMTVVGKGTIGRPHIARLLVQKKVVKSMQEAFDRFLGLGGAAYFPKDELPLKQGIELLHEAGAVTSVAHPGLLKRTFEGLETSLQEWRSCGLDGIEAIYSAYTEEQSAFFSRMAEKIGFLVTGGSDFHGDNKPHIKIGVGKGDLKVPDEILEPLLKRQEEVMKSIR